MSVPSADFSPGRPSGPSAPSAYGGPSSQTRSASNMHASSPAPAYRLEGQGTRAAVREPAEARRPVPEALLQDLWRRQHFDTTALRTTEGRLLTVLDPGRLNPDAGPDFYRAHLQIGGQPWHGDVEIHPAARGWFDHGHHRDPRYNAVVLHVSLYRGSGKSGLVREDGSPLPELVLAPRLTAPLHQLLHDFRTREEEAIFCAPRWSEVPGPLRSEWVEAMAEERFERKKERLVDRYFAVPSLEELLHERLFAGLGYAKNDVPMSDLARRLPLARCRRLTGRRDLEALLLGTAGLLPAPSDLTGADRATADYATDLVRRFERLEHACNLEAPMARTRWQFFRLRPANFPPLRIAQAAALLAPGGLLQNDPLGALLAAVRAEKPVPALHTALAAEPSDFWKTHFRLKKATKPRDPSAGQPRRNTLITNAVVPVLLLYAEQHDDRTLKEALRTVLRQLPPGSDRVTRRFKKLGTPPQDTLEAQGLHQLYRTRCSEARCLDCRIGRYLLGR